MARRVFIAFWLAVAWAAFSGHQGDAAGYQEPPLGWTTKAEVVRVVDGDTIDVEVRRTVRIRLLECWAPETRTRDAVEKRRGLAAKDHLKDLIGSKAVTLHVPTDGSGDVAKILTLNRVLGRVYIEGVDVSAAMVAAGHATKERD